LLDDGSHVEKLQRQKLKAKRQHSLFVGKTSLQQLTVEHITLNTVASPAKLFMTVSFLIMSRFLCKKASHKAKVSKDKIVSTVKLDYILSFFKSGG